jgi:hypothetical protein
MIGFSQQKTVSGNVTEENGLPLPGATVIEQGANNGTTTDFDGNFNISVQDGSTLLFPMLDMQIKNWSLVNQKILIFRDKLLEFKSKDLPQHWVDRLELP